MKKIILLLSIFFLFADCKEEKPLEEPPEEPQLNTDSIYGTWQLVERIDYGSLGHQEFRRKVSDGAIIVFYRNYSYYYSEGDVCPGSNPPISGRFRMSNNCIEFGLYCTEDTYDGTGKHIYSLRDNHLFLSPTCCCPEGCSRKYKKTADPEGD